MNPSISNDRVRDIVKTVNGIAPDINGEVTTPIYVQTINNNPPDVFWNITIADTIDIVSSNNTIQWASTGTPGQYDIQARVSGSFSNWISAVSDWLYVSKLASDIETTPYGAFPTWYNVQSALQQVSDYAQNSPSGVSDTDTINLSLSGGYISWDIKIDPATNNLLSSSIAWLKASNSAIDIKTGSLTWYWFDGTVTDTRSALIYLWQNRVISQPVGWVGVPTSPFFADSSISWRTGAMVNEYMQRFTNPYGVPGYTPEFGIVANPNLGSGIAFTLSAFWDDSQRFTLWVNATGKVMVKSGPLPTSDSDWVVVGTQS